MRSKHSEFSRTARNVVLINALSVPVAWALQVALSRLLGENAFGDLMFAHSCIFFLTVLGTLGMDRASIRFVAFHLALEDWGLLRGFLSHSVNMVLVRSIGISIVVGIVLIFQGDRLSPELLALAWVACGVIPLRCVLDTVVGSISGFGRVATSQIVHALLRGGTQIVGLFAFYVFVRGPTNGAQALALEAFTSVGILLFVLWLRGRIVRREVPATDLQFRRSLWSGTASQLALIAGFRIVMYKTDIVMLGVVEGNETAGHYAAASFLAGIVLIGFQAVTSVASPRISAMIAREDKSGLQSLLTFSTRRAFAFTLALGAALIAFRSPVLGTFGPTFGAGKTALLVLVGGQLVNALMGPVGLVLNMANHQRTVLTVLGIGAFSNVGLNYFLIPVWGLNGAAVATALTIAGINIVLAILVRTKLKLRTTII